MAAEADAKHAAALAAAQAVWDAARAKEDTAREELRTVRQQWRSDQALAQYAPPMPEALQDAALPSISNGQSRQNPQQTLQVLFAHFAHVG